MFSKKEFKLQGPVTLFFLILTSPIVFLRRLVVDFGGDSVLYNALTCKHMLTKSLVDLRGKVAVITGSNTGIGKRTAYHLASLGATVVIACRDTERGNAAVADINADLRRKLKGLNSLSRGRPNAAVGNAEFIALDLASFSSIADFSEKLKNRYDRLDILVNNAGVNNEGTTDDGLQQLFQVNYLGHYLLFRLLEPLLSKRSTAAITSDQCAKEEEEEDEEDVGRVVNLSSVMHHMGSIDYEASAYSRHGISASRSRKMSDGEECKEEEKGESERKQDDKKAPHSSSPHSSSANYSYYDDSKFYMNLLTMEINRRHALGSVDDSMAVHTESISKSANQGASLSANHQGVSRPIIAVSANPGAVRSDIWRHVPPVFMWIYDLFMRAAYLSVDQGSATSVYAALVPVKELRRRKYLIHTSNTDKSIELAVQQESSSGGSESSAETDSKKNYGTTIDGSSPSQSLLTSPCPSNSVEGKWCDHPLVPYVIPYFMPFPLMAFEMLGAYHGPNFGKISLPPRSDAVAEGLWKFSEKLCFAAATSKPASNQQLLNSLNRLNIAKTAAKRIGR